MVQAYNKERCILSLVFVFIEADVGNCVQFFTEPLTPLLIDIPRYQSDISFVATNRDITSLSKLLLCWVKSHLVMPVALSEY